MTQRLNAVVMMLCAVAVGASASGFHGKSINPLATWDTPIATPELDGMGSVATVTLIGAVGYGAMKIYNKLFRRNRS